MKKSKTLKRTYDSKIKFLNNYFDHFKYRDFIYDKIIETFLIEEQSCEKFKKIIRGEYPKIKCGKNTKLFWTQRGYTEEESIKLSIPYKSKRDVTRSPMNIQFWINKGFSEEESLFKIKSQRKMNREYWITRGYTEEESVIKVREYQKENSLKLKEKKRKNPEKFNDINTNQIKYWLNKGYTEEESVIKVKKRQTTFSKEICIDKYGEIEGMKIWEKRQEKWIDSLMLSNYNLSDNKGISIKNKIKRYNINRLIDSLSISNKEIFKKLFKSCDTIEKFIIEYSNYFRKNNDEITLYRFLRPIIRLKILHEYYNTNQNHILSLLIPKIARVETPYSNISWFNGHICRSDSEYIISNWLFKNNIKYEYEKYYEGSRMRCDFYLIDYDIYVEYMGMRENKYKTKINFLNTNNISYIASDNVSDIKIKILECVNNTNK